MKVPNVSNPKRVLLVEDHAAEARVLTRLVRSYGGVIEIVWASSSDVAVNVYRELKGSLWAIVFDGYLETTSRDDTLPIIALVKSDGFSGHMIAYSGNPDMMKRMVRAGCTERCPKDEVINVLLELLRDEGIEIPARSVPPPSSS